MDETKSEAGTNKSETNLKLKLGQRQDTPSEGKKNRIVGKIVWKYIFPCATAPQG